MSDDDVDSIDVRDQEIERWRFVDVDDIRSEMRQHVWRRLRAAADSVTTGTTMYLERQPG